MPASGRRLVRRRSQAFGAYLPGSFGGFSGALADIVQRIPAGFIAGLSLVGSVRGFGERCPRRAGSAIALIRVRGLCGILRNAPDNRRGYERPGFSARIANPNGSRSRIRVATRYETAI
jgi:hypothetical protein